MKSPRAILLPYQQHWMNDQAQKKIWLASRQIGKSFALSMEAVVEGLERKCNNLVLSSSERQSREVMQKVYSHLRVLRVVSEDIIFADDASREEVKLPNGSRIISLPANPDTVRGFSGNVFLDEFAFHKDADAIWRAMYPTVTRGYKIRVCSTANGKSNMFYRLWSEGGFSRHETSVYEAKAAGLEVDIEALRRGIADPDAWVQEYECRFVDEATAFITYEMITGCEDENATKDSDLSNLPSPLFGKEGNPTLAKGGMGGFERIRIRRCCIDSTGLGAQLAEEAIDRFGPTVEAVLFTQKVKEDLAVTLRRKFEDRQVRIPADRDIREDFHSVKKFTTSAGNIRFNAERTDLGHADRFWAAALGVHAGSTACGGIIEFETAGPARVFSGIRGFTGGGRPSW